MRLIVVLVALLFAMESTIAQSFSGEVSFGHNAITNLISGSKYFSHESKWGISATFNSNMPYDKSSTAYNYHIIQPMILYSVIKKPKIITNILFGSFKNPKHYGGLLGVQAVIPFKDGKIVLTNQHQFAEDYFTSIIFIGEYKPKINNKFRLYLRAQVMSETDFNIFTRNFQILRLGLEYKQIQFGAGATFDQFNNQTISHENYGAFIRTTIK